MERNNSFRELAVKLDKNRLAMLKKVMFPILLALPWKKNCIFCSLEQRILFSDMENVEFIDLNSNENAHLFIVSF